MKHKVTADMKCGSTFKVTTIKSNKTYITAKIVLSCYNCYYNVLKKLVNLLFNMQLQGF